ncbi:acyltransferase family protein [Rhizobium sp. BE258]|uniref:acyltransferase family protein n=1 Tax=Rhizobium sp. BE258 TaxID=2817722 RepID=UPI00285BB558|nr:acyltransferase family protein [Rhizobium sp. BE258]MDR7145314.1 peptidoglycan/LPS O-acetylase OafA/YrhL [Rhizobium sp. BE258]
MKYRPEIDGLRAIAVIPVVLFHAGVSGFPGGYIGVDIFFVISGYLITRIIDESLSQGRFSIGEFYERRFRRIVPALLFFVLLTTVIAWFVLLPSFLEDYAKSLLSVGTFTSNIYFWKFSGYFENSAHLRPLLHTWSLAVEEQFYIVMPLALWLISPLRRSSRLIVVALAAAVSFALSIYATSVAPTANFFLLPTRSWELLVGSMLAIGKVKNPFGQPVNSLIGLSGLALIGFAVTSYSEATPFPGFAAIAPCLGAACIIYSGGRNSSLADRILSLSPIVFIGQISYSLYLAHWPVTVFLRYATLEEPSPWHALAIVILSLALAVFSWRFVESPFRSNTFTWSRASVIGASLGSLAVLTLAGYVGVANSGFKNRFPDYQIAVEARAKDVAALVSSTNGAAPAALTWRNGTCFFEDDNTFENWDSKSCVLTSGSGPVTLLWGDSYAAHYAPGLAANAPLIGSTVYQYTEAGCPPILAYYSYARPRCQDFNRKALEIVDALNVKTVILSGRWVDLQLRGLDLLQDTVSSLTAKGLRVIVIGQSPMFVTNVDVIAYRKAGITDATALWSTVIAPSFNGELKAQAEGADFIDPIAIECDDGICPYIDEGRMLYFDSGHLSNFGSTRLIKRLFPLQSASR